MSLWQNVARVAPRLAVRLARGQRVVPPPSLTVSRKWPTTVWQMLPRTLATLDESQNKNNHNSNIWYTRQPKKGTGFDNFIPRDDDKDADKQESDESSSSSSPEGQDPQKKEKPSAGDKQETSTSNDKNFAKDNKAKSEGKSEGGGSGRNNNNDPDRFENWIPALVMLFITYYLSQRSGADDPPEGRSMDREISWHDFLRLLQQQDITKIVVTDNRQSARVYLKSNAKGLVGRSSTNRMPIQRRTISYEEQRRRAATREHPDDQEAQQQQEQHHQDEYDAFHDQAQEQLQGLEHTSEEDMGNRPGHAPFFYRMHIGSVETFERKLDEAQRALKRDPASDVPVQYLPEQVRVNDLKVVNCTCNALLILNLFVSLTRSRSVVNYCPLCRASCWPW